MHADMVIHNSETLKVWWLMTTCNALSARLVQQLSDRVKHFVQMWMPWSVCCGARLMLNI